MSFMLHCDFQKIGCLKITFSKYYFGREGEGHNKGYALDNVNNSGLLWTSDIWGCFRSYHHLGAIYMTEKVTAVF